jgi:hypothetical protein
VALKLEALMIVRLLACSSLVFIAAVASAADTPSPAQAATPKSQEKVCEKIVFTGSRIAARKYCGTRAEWEDHRQQDKQAVDQIQSRLNGPCSIINQHSGTPTC